MRTIEISVTELENGEIRYAKRTIEPMVLTISGSSAGDVLKSIVDELQSKLDEHNQKVCSEHNNKV